MRLHHYKCPKCGSQSHPKRVCSGCGLHLMIYELEKKDKEFEKMIEGRQR